MASPARLVDYYVEVVAVPCAPTPDNDLEAFERRIVRRLPVDDHRDFALPDGVPFFCIPDCLDVLNPSVYERKPTFFSFSLTGGDGSRAYGFALHTFEQTRDHASTTTAWRPRVLCVISHHPFFSLFKELVSWIYRTRITTAARSPVRLGRAPPPPVLPLDDDRRAEAILAEETGRRSWFLSPRAAAPEAPSSSTTTTTATTSWWRRRPSLVRAASEGAAAGASPRAVGPRQPPPSTLSSSSATTATTTTSSASSSEMCARANKPHDDDNDNDDDDPARVVLHQLIAEATAPAPGGVLALRFHARPFFTYHVQRGNLPHLDDYCFQVLFQCLSLPNVVYVLNCMLLEQRILIHSNHHGLLTPVCEALCALLFPFTWEHVYVPFLPVKLIEYLQAPVPYLMGLHTSSLATRIGAEIFSSCVVVHLDKDKVVTPISSRVDDSPMDFVLARLPPHEVDALVAALGDRVPRPAHAAVAPTLPPGPNNGSSASDGGGTEVELTFGDGPLGITLESTHLRLLAANGFQLGKQPGVSAVVKALPRLHNGLPGPAERSNLVRPGSFLVAINGRSTLDLSFDETIDRLRLEPRPLRLRFLNAESPHETACRFAERLQSLSLVSALQVDHANALLPWVDATRGAFAVLFTSVLRDYQRFICIEHVAAGSGGGHRHRPKEGTDPHDDPSQPTTTPQPHATVGTRRRRSSSALALSVTFDHASFCETASAAPARCFLREFTQSQAFAGFVNDSVMGRVAHTTDAHPQLELFQHCVHLYHELGDQAAPAAIALLFERDPTAIATHTLDLPRAAAETAETTDQDAPPPTPAAVAPAHASPRRALSSPVKHDENDRGRDIDLAPLARARLCKLTLEDEPTPEDELALTPTDSNLTSPRSRLSSTSSRSLSSVATDDDGESHALGPETLDEELWGAAKALAAESITSGPTQQQELEDEEADARRYCH